MKSTEPNKYDEALNRQLRCWVVKSTLSPRFHEQVWQRIEQPKTQLEFNVFSWLLNSVEATLRRPAMAVVYALLLLVAGSAFGWSQAQKDKAQLSETLSLRYVQTIDPYQRFR